MIFYLLLILLILSSRNFCLLYIFFSQALENPNNICISQRNFAIGIAIAGLVLMLMVIAAFVILLTRRRTKKDVSSGSSIYSGPYTNTAYSHSS